MKKPRNKLHSSFNLNNNIMNPIKTSLKKKISNTIMEQHHNINGKQNDAATQTILSHYKK
jgi:DNA-binding cell septation regulator SpoVG